MAGFLRVVRLLSTLGGVLAVLLLLLALFVVCQLVFVRYVLGASAIWQHEMVTFSLIGATFLGAAYVARMGGHVGVDLLAHYLGRRGRRLLGLSAALLSLAFCLVVTWLGAAWWWEAWINDWHHETVWAPPLWIPYLAMPVGMGLLCLHYLADILILVTGADPDAVRPPGPAL